MRASIESSLGSAYDADLVRELLDAHDEAKRNFYLGGLRLSAVEGGRFCEAAFRMLEQEIDAGKFTKLGKTLNTENLINRLRTTPFGSHPESVRLHIPRALRVVYDIRNSRNAAHLGDGIDPNVQDATLVAGVLDWVLAEFIRLHHNVPADEAHRIVVDLVERKTPVIQDFDGFLKVLTKLGASDHCLVLLYQRGAAGATLDELDSWVLPPMRQNLRRTMNRLVNEKLYAHFDGQRYFITLSGITDVEARRLIEP